MRSTHLIAVALLSTLVAAGAATAHVDEVVGTVQPIVDAQLGALSVDEFAGVAIDQAVYAKVEGEAIVLRATSALADHATSQVGSVTLELDASSSLEHLAAGDLDGATRHLVGEAATPSSLVGTAGIGATAATEAGSLGVQVALELQSALVSALNALVAA